jgi:hypothetical protein
MSCKKKGTLCRISFPRPPSDKIFISKPQDSNEISEEQLVKEKVAKERLSVIWDTVKSCENVGISTTDLLKKAGMTEEEFEKCFSFVTKRNTVVHQRQTNEIYTNQYSKHLLRAWDANMDIQYILDAFSYVVYKAERELGLLLHQTTTEAVDENLNAQGMMKKVGTAYLHLREVSAQEAVYSHRPTVERCSRKVEFIPVGENAMKMSIPLKEIERKKHSPPQKKKKQQTNKLSW